MSRRAQLAASMIAVGLLAGCAAPGSRASSDSPVLPLSAASAASTGPAASAASAEPAASTGGASSDPGLGDTRPPCPSARILHVDLGATRDEKRVDDTNRHQAVRRRRCRLRPAGRRCEDSLGPARRRCDGYATASRPHCRACLLCSGRVGQARLVPEAHRRHRATRGEGDTRTVQGRPVRAASRRAQRAAERQLLHRLPGVGR